MSCRVWEELAAAGEAVLREDAPERLRAEAHFRECPSCAEKAFLLDPSWAVRKLPAPEFGAEDLAEIQRSLARAERMRGVERRFGTRHPGRRIAAAAVLVALLGVAGILSDRSNSVEVADSGGFLVKPGAEGRQGDPADELELSLPAIGSLAPETARIYELGEEEFALVMVVHETLDL